MGPALGHGEWEAVDALLRHGARERLAVAAATGRTDAARAAIPSAGAGERHLALALAARYGHSRIADVVEYLKRAGAAG